MRDKIPDTSGLFKKTDYNAKITKIEGKIPSISSLTTNSALTAVENKIRNISSLVKNKKQKKQKQKNRLWHKNYWNRTETYWS